MPNIQSEGRCVYFYLVIAIMEQLVFDKAIYDTIRRNIKKYRKEKGLTSAQLAEMVELSHDFIRQIESEKVKYNFSVATFYKISVALGVGMDQLAGICTNDNSEKAINSEENPEKYS